MPRPCVSGRATAPAQLPRDFEIGDWSDGKLVELRRVVVKDALTHCDWQIAEYVGDVLLRPWVQTCGVGKVSLEQHVADADALDGDAWPEVLEPESGVNVVPKLLGGAHLVVLYLGGHHLVPLVLARLENERDPPYTALY